MMIATDPRVFECPHCSGMGWYETDQVIESGNGWDEPRTYEYVEADCKECDGTGWAK
jgi:hypothetical protein